MPRKIQAFTARHMEFKPEPDEGEDCGYRKLGPPGLPANFGIPVAKDNEPISES